jgi:hypothetical protein
MTEGSPRDWSGGGGGGITWSIPPDDGDGAWCGCAYGLPPVEEGGGGGTIGMVRGR